MNEEITDAIVESVRDVFQGFLAMELFVGTPHGADGLVDPDTGIAGLALAMECSAVVGFTGAMRGAISVQGAHETVRLLVGALAKRPVTALTLESLELFGELGDLIAGGMRSRLSSHGEIHAAPPQVIVGQRYIIHNARIYSRVRHTFQFSGGLFLVECHYLKDCA
ncbi:MAG: chemotaxis protein CheX [Magnetococcales bacterium]|nr:chemotaxis protein CheX [Magnetococcales bacterium]NGZ05785.1 chemotaxis protein CheX [Magnetococcales bacterium]